MCCVHAQTIKAQIWDTAGQERYRAITSAYYRGAVGALVVYDITKDVSFENVEKWLAELKENATADITMMLVGNKTDLANQRLVSTEQGKAYAESRGITFLEASALQNANVEASFLQILSEIYHKKASKEASSAAAAGGAGGSNTLKVEIKSGAKKKPLSCCQ